MADLRDSLSRNDISIRDKYLLILEDQHIPLTNQRLKEIAKTNGWKKGAVSSPAAFLSSAKGIVVQIPEGWVLTSAGTARIVKLGQGTTLHAQVISPLAAALEKHARSVPNSQRAAFISEAVSCLRAQHYRAAIVLSWVGAVSVLYDYVILKKLPAFNKQAAKYLKKPAQTADDLATIKESVFLDLIEDIRMITPSQKKELKTCLGRRNTAGHPNSQMYREAAVASHIDALIVEVFQRF
jgi:hypothetical protein